MPYTAKDEMASKVTACKLVEDFWDLVGGGGQHGLLQRQLETIPEGLSKAAKTGHPGTTTALGRGHHLAFAHSQHVDADEEHAGPNGVGVAPDGE